MLQEHKVVNKEGIKLHMYIALLWSGYYTLPNYSPTNHWFSENCHCIPILHSELHRNLTKRKVAFAEKPQYFNQQVH